MTTPHTDDVHLERIWPTGATLAAFFAKFPDHEQRYVWAQEIVAGLRVADIACGCGYGCAILAETAAQVDGFDIAAEAIDHAKTNFARPNVTFTAGAQLPAGQYDVVTSFETLEHMSEADGDAFLAMLRAALKPGGRLVLSTPLNRSPHKHNVTPYHIREYDHDELLAKMRAAGLVVEEVYGQGNALSRRVQAKGVGGVSLRDVLNLGVHRLLPPVVRNLLKRLMGLQPPTSAPTVTLVKGSVEGAFVQMVVARRG